MSARYSLDIACDYLDPLDWDHGRCPEWDHGLEAERPPTVAEGRAEVAADGWVRRFGPSSCGYDLCPDHADERPGETFPDWRKA